MPVAEDFKPLNPGGTAEKHPQMPVSKDEVQAGIPVEKEHTTSTEKARAIAVDHVVEIPDYYKRLEKLENEAKEDGVKRADRLLQQLEALPSLHQQEIDEATRAANADLDRHRVLGEVGAGVGSAFSAIPGIGLLLPSHSDLHNDARAALEARAQAHAENLGALQEQHAQEAADLLHQLRARAAGKLASDATQDVTQMGAAPHGDELHLPMGPNPYMGDPKASAEFENGFDYAQALGHNALNQATEGDVQRWVGNSNAWRDGFAEACSKLGLARVGNLVAAQPKTAAVPSALEPAGHWSRGLGAVLGAGGGVAAHSLWGDPGELYTLVPAALGGVAAGTVAGDLGHSLSQQSEVNPAVPIRSTDDPRVRTPQALAALAGLGLGAGLGYVGGHYGVPESWHDTSGGHMPEIVGTSLGGIGGAIAGSALEDRLAGRPKQACYTLRTTEDPMPRLEPMPAVVTDDSLIPLKVAEVVPADEAKVALHPALTALLGAGIGGAAGGYFGHQAGADYADRLGDYTAQMQAHQASPAESDPAVFQSRPTDDALNVVHRLGGEIRSLPGVSSLIPDSSAAGTGLAGGAALGAGAGGLVGLGAGMLTHDPRRPEMTRMAALNLDSDVEGSALDALQDKVAALGTTLGTLAGIGGGALAGNYLAPAMHWAAMPGEHAAVQHAIAQEVAPQVEQVAAEPGGQVNVQFSPEQIQALQHGAQAAQGAEWSGVSNVGRTLGAGIGGVAGYQAGRGIDEAFGLEKKERPLVISPMPRPGF